MGSFLNLIEVVANGKRAELDFGDELVFYRGEIHMIKVIGDNPGIYVSEMARYFNVTRAVVSKTVIKLARNGFVRKEDDTTNKKLTCLYLTAKGETAYQAHEAFHLKNDYPVYQYLSALNDEQLDLIFDLMEKLNKMVKNHF